MGNVISLEVFSLDLVVLPQFGTEESPWAFLTFLLITFIGIMASGVFICRNFARFKHSRRKGTWTPPPSILVILCLVFILLPIVQSRPGKDYLGYRSPSKNRKFAKPILKHTAPLFIPPALYLAFDQFLQFLQKPEPSAEYISTVGALSTLAIIFLYILAKFCLTLGKHFFPNLFPSPTISPIPPVPNNSIELRELNNTVAELVQRSNPPPHRL